jgi:glycosyltransferase involved in cell wall biosynthesis
LVSYLVSNADVLIACGPHISDWLATEFGRTKDVFVMPNAVDNAHFRKPVPSEVLHRFRAEHDLRGVTACYVGRLDREKDLETLLRAIAKTSVTLVIAGDGPLRPKLEEVARRQPAADRMRFIGWVPQRELPTVYQACDIFVLPSITTRLVRETWGMAVNEAMNAGLPVIGTPAVGAVAGGLVTDGSTGWVVPERDEAALARALGEAAANGEERRLRGARGQALVTQYTHAAAADVFSSALEWAANTKGGAPS